MHEVLVNRLGGLSLPRKSVVRLTHRPDMTLDVYRGRKTTMQQQQQHRCSDISHVVIKRTIYTLFAHTFFSATFSRIKTALFMYTRIHVHASMRLRKCIYAVSRQNLSWK